MRPRLSRPARGPAVLAAPLLPLLPLLAGPGAAQAVAAERPTARAARVASPPRIDGRLDDPAWSLAEPIGELTQVEPVLGVPPSEATEVRVLHDADRLYLGIRCYDREPAGIITTTRERDAFLDVDDRVEIVIDTFLDRRNAYFFQINAGGSKGDALITNNGADFNKPWDGIWEGKARVDEEGWTAELAIPFKTMSFAEGGSTWGFNLERYVGRKREEARWANPSRDNGLFFVYGAGDLTGLRDIRQGIGLDVVPFAVGQLEKDRESDPSSHLLGDVGLDAFYKVTPNLTLSLTANTDFAETEVDERQINLTRFSLFFPERRDFFLQDAGLFEFADLGRDLIPFFSRTIGLDEDGGEVPILAGAKLTGRAGDYSVGLLDVRTDDATTESGPLPGENLFVARVTKNVGEQSTVGALVTHGNPAGTGDNTVVGLDANFRTSSFRGDQNLRSSVWALASDTEGAATDDELAWGASLGSPNDVWSWSLAFKEIQEDFDPALGFVPRRGIRAWDGGLEWEPRVSDTIRNLEFSVDAEVVTDTGDELETREVELQPFGIDWESGDSFRVELVDVRDELDADFEIVDGVTIPTGTYDWTRWRVELDTAEERDVSLSLSVEGGGFFDGDRDGYGATLGWRPGALFLGSAEYRRNEVFLPGGEFKTEIARLRGVFSFTPDLSWNNFLQWDSESDTVGVHSRLRWIPEPGQEVFLVLDETLDTAGGSVSPLFTGLALKLVYTLRL